MENEGRSFSATWALRQIDSSRAMLKQLDGGTLLLWAHEDSAIPQVMYARIRVGATPQTFDYEAVDTLSSSEHILTHGSFALRGPKFVLLKEDGCDEFKAFALLARVIRRCGEKPLTEGGTLARGAWCTEPAEGTDLTPLLALAMTYMGVAASKGLPS